MAPGLEPRMFIHGEDVFRISEMEVDKRKNRTPYWVMRVPKTIIKSHGDIFNDGFTALIGALLRSPEVTDPACQGGKSTPASLKRRHNREEHSRTSIEGQLSRKLRFELASSPRLATFTF